MSLASDAEARWRGRTDAFRRSLAIGVVDFTRGDAVVAPSARSTAVLTVASFLVGAVVGAAVAVAIVLG